MSYPPPLRKQDYEAGAERAYQSGIAEQMARAEVQHAQRHLLEAQRKLQLVQQQERKHAQHEAEEEAMEGRRSMRKNKRKFFPKRKSACKKRHMVWKSSSKKCNLKRSSKK